MDHVLLERAAHDNQTVLRAPDWDHKASGQLVRQFALVRRFSPVAISYPLQGYVALRVLYAGLCCG